MVINRELMKIQNGIEERFRKMQTELGDITLNELADSLKGKTKAPETIVAYLDLKISELKNRIGIDLAQTTFYKFNRTATYFKDFLQDKQRQQDLAISRIDKTMLEVFFN
jgi:hypothetical protein